MSLKIQKKKKNITKKILNNTETQPKNIQKHLINVYIISLAVLICLIFGYSFYLKCITQPKEKEAFNEMALIQDLFIKDSLDKSLVNKKGIVGFEDIIENFSGTNAAKLASYYLGIILFKKGEYQKALNNFKNFSSEDKILNAITEGAIGDCYSELGLYSKALYQFEKAIKMTNNSFISFFFAKKLTILCIEIHDYKKALSCLNKLKKKFSEEFENFPELHPYIKMLEYKNDRK